MFFFRHAVLPQSDQYPLKKLFVEFLELQQDLRLLIGNLQICFRLSNQETHLSIPLVGSAESPAESCSCGQIKTILRPLQNSLFVSPIVTCIKIQIADILSPIHHFRVFQNLPQVSAVPFLTRLDLVTIPDLTQSFPPSVVLKRGYSGLEFSWSLRW